MDVLVMRVYVETCCNGRSCIVRLPLVQGPAPPATGEVLKWRGFSGGVYENEKMDLILHIIWQLGLEI
jgi:hypothetical protein